MIHVTLTNRKAVFNCPPESLERLKSWFSYPIPRAEFSDKYIRYQRALKDKTKLLKAQHPDWADKAVLSTANRELNSRAYELGIWNGTKCLLARGTVPAGLFLMQREKMELHGWKFQVDDQRKAPEFSAILDPEGTRPYQSECVQRMIETSRTGGLILSATGSGKTHLVSVFLQKLCGSAVFLVDELTLLGQAQNEFAKILSPKEIGQVGNSVFDPRRVTVATIQTLHKHRNRPEFRRWFESLDCAIIDEVHLALNKRNIDIVQRVRPKAVYGLTATLEMEKPHVRFPAVALAGPPIFTYPLEQGVREGYLSQGVVCRVFVDQPALNFRDANAEYNALVTHGEKRNGVIEALVREGIKQGKRVVVLVERLAHLEGLRCRLQDLNPGVMCGVVEKTERTAAIKSMDSGKLPLILATRVFSKGVDITQVSLVIDASGQPSPNSAQQRYGRGSRKAEGKDGLLYVDITDRGNRFAHAANSRCRALRALGVPIIEQEYRGNAGEILETAQKSLENPEIVTKGSSRS